MDSIMIGQYSVAALIVLLLVIVFKLIEGDKPGSMSDRVKIVVTICVGVGIGIILMLYDQQPWNAKTIITYITNGFGASCMASGFWTYVDKGVIKKT